MSRAGIDRKDVTLNADLSYAPRKQVAILAARIENRNSLHVRIIVDSLQSTVFSRQSAVDSRQSTVGSRQSVPVGG